jgi:hypothetical protein
MTSTELKIAHALQNCNFLPGSFDKKFSNQLNNWEGRDMTQKGRDKMLEMLYKYRRQIHNYQDLRREIQDERLKGGNFEPIQ